LRPALRRIGRQGRSPGGSGTGSNSGDGSVATMGLFPRGRLRSTHATRVGEGAASAPCEPSSPPRTQHLSTTRARTLTV